MFDQILLFSTHVASNLPLKLFPKLPPNCPKTETEPAQKRGSKVENNEWNHAIFALVFPLGSRIKQQICPPFNLYAIALCDQIVMEAY